MCLFDVLLPGERERETEKGRARGGREKETEKKERLCPAQPIEEGGFFLRPIRQLQFSATEFCSACLCCRLLRSAGGQIVACAELIDGRDVMNKMCLKKIPACF